MLVTMNYNIFIKEILFKDILLITSDKESVERFIIYNYRVKILCRFLLTVTKNANYKESVSNSKDQDFLMLKSDFVKNLKLLVNSYK